AVCDVLAVEDDSPATGWDHAEDAFERRRLASSVVAEDGDALSPPDMQVDVVDDLLLAVRGVEILDPEEVALRLRLRRRQGGDGSSGIRLFQSRPPPDARSASSRRS